MKEGKERKRGRKTRTGKQGMRKEEEEEERREEDRREIKSKR